MGYIPFSQAGRLETKADIVFCIDATMSMDPCFNGVRQGLTELVDGLKSAAEVDYRLRLLAYRDLHDCPDQLWNIFDFTSSVDEFKRQLSSVTPFGGDSIEESTLDALYMAIHSDWRIHKTHKTIVLLTDADTHPTLYPTTYNRPDNDINRVIQDFQTLRHAMLFMILPRYEAYKKIEASMRDADRQIIAYFVPPGDDRYKGLNNIDWTGLMKLLGQTVSQTSLTIEE